MSVFPYTSKNLLRTFQISFSVKYLYGSSTYSFDTKRMFDATDINSVFNTYSKGSCIPSYNIFPFLNSLLPFLPKDSDDFTRFCSFLDNDETFCLYIYNFTIHTLKIY